MKTMNFGQALEAMKKGVRVTRIGWNGTNMHVYYVPAKSYPSMTDSAKKEFGPVTPYRAYLAIKTAQHDVATWSPSTSDCLAEDWKIYGDFSIKLSDVLPLKPKSGPQPDPKAVKPESNGSLTFDKINEIINSKPFQRKIQELDAKFAKQFIVFENPVTQVSPELKTWLHPLEEECLKKIVKDEERIQLKYIYGIDPISDPVTPVNETPEPGYTKQSLIDLLEFLQRDRVADACFNGQAITSDNKRFTMEEIVDLFLEKQ